VRTPTITRGSSIISGTHRARATFLRSGILSRRHGLARRERERERYLCTINISVWYFCAAMVMQYLYALHSVLMFAFVMIPIVYEWSEDR